MISRVPGTAAFVELSVIPIDEKAVSYTPTESRALGVIRCGASLGGLFGALGWLAD